MSAPQPVRDTDAVPSVAERIRGEVEGLLRRLVPDADHVSMHYVRRRTRTHEETVWEMSVRSRTPRETTERPVRRWPR